MILHLSLYQARQTHCDPNHFPRTQSIRPRYALIPSCNAPKIITVNPTNKTCIDIQKFHILSFIRVSLQKVLHVNDKSKCPTGLHLSKTLLGYDKRECHKLYTYKALGLNKH